MNDSITEFGRTGPLPALSICVMQHNRTSFFLRALASYAAQSFRDFEICVSDGGSTDGRENEVLDALRATGLPFVYRKSTVNLRYDPNTRTAIGLARGRRGRSEWNHDLIPSPPDLQR